MSKNLLSIGMLLLLSTAAALAGPRVTMDTNFGSLVLELNDARAPETVANFLAYVQDGFYNETLFHRVIEDFMIQGGGFTADFKQKPTRPPIRNEASNGLKNVRGSIVMARTSDPHSATSQFFINVKDNPFLDYPSSDGWGYAVFGKVVQGMDVADRISQVPTGSGGPFPKDVPQTPVLIHAVTVTAETTDDKTITAREYSND
jgi:cyclophilin family peptidyl-prolyl cis-trans isomerase